MLDRAVDRLLAAEGAADVVDHHPEVRRNVGALTVARLCANTCYRFAPPFLATIARGLDVSLDDLGVALAVSELCGLASPLTARLVDRVPRRSALVVAAIGVAAGTCLAAASTGIVMFAVALVLLGQSKVAYDLALGSWIADHVPYERRSQVVGITETSWALGLLVGVSIAGLVTALTNWRGGYLVAAAAVLGMALHLRGRLASDGSESLGRARVHESTPSAPDDSIERQRLDGVGLGARGRWVVVAAFGLMSASQCLFVTFGSWLDDTFSFGPASIAAVVMGLGVGELAASVTAARRTDRWGKLRSTSGGAGLMVPAGIVLAVGHGHLGSGLGALAVGILGFEFAIVSLLAVGSTLVPSSPARGLAVMLTGGTLGRALASIPATGAYDRHGMAWPALLSAGFALFTVVALAFAARAGRTEGRTLTA